MDVTEMTWLTGRELDVDVVGGAAFQQTRRQLAVLHVEDHVGADRAWNTTVFHQWHHTTDVCIILAQINYFNVLQKRSILVPLPRRTRGLTAILEDRSGGEGRHTQSKEDGTHVSGKDFEGKANVDQAVSVASILGRLNKALRFQQA